MKHHEFDKVIKKFGFEVENSKDLHAWLKVDGRILARTKRSHCKGDLPAERLILKQLQLTQDEFRAADKCTLSRDAYIKKLTEREG